MSHPTELATAAPRAGQMKAVMVALSGESAAVQDTVLKALHMGMNNPGGPMPGEDLAKFILRVTGGVLLPPDVVARLTQIVPRPLNGGDGETA